MTMIRSVSSLTRTPTLTVQHPKELPYLVDEIQRSRHRLTYSKRQLALVHWHELALHPEGSTNDEASIAMMCLRSGLDDSFDY